MNKTLIRIADAEDRPACVEIYARGKPMAVAGFQDEIDQATFDKDTEDEVIFIAERDGVIVAFAGYYEPGNFLHHLYVDPDLRGQGIGSALLKAVQAQAMSGLSLKVQLSNHLARAFYAAHGFIEGERGEDQSGPWLRYIAP